MSEAEDFYRLSEEQKERILSGERSGEPPEIDTGPNVCEVAGCLDSPAYRIDHKGRPEPATVVCESHREEAEATVGAEVLGEL